MGFHHLALFLHLVGVVLWVGGMAFIRVCLISPALTGAQWAEALERFFPLAWMSIALIVVSGGFMLSVTGAANAPWAWLAMSVLGTAMIIVFASIRFGPWVELRVALARGGLAQAQARAAIARIEKRLDVTLALAILTATMATLGLGI
ncbi:MAG: CopD family protein [Azoarcus sp.]|nr:CopD family protein [Azoarcus sp.]